MPVIEVKLYEHRVTEESVPKMIEALTSALAESSGAAPEHIQVIIEGVSPEALGHRRQARRELGAEPAHGRLSCSCLASAWQRS